jgi:Calcineurin-like phosphoesterase
MKRMPRLLIIDDELDLVPAGGGESRRTLYEKLNGDFDISFAEGPATVHEVIERGGYDALLVDFVLEEWRLHAPDIIRSVDDKVPIALISQNWSANFDKLSSTIATFPIARLFTWDDMATPRTREIIVFWINAAIRERYGSLAIGYGADEPLRIVQFSDMQFNAKNGELHETDTHVAIQKILSTWGEPPHFLALPGDIAEAGRPVEYDLARKWIDAVSGRLGQGKHAVEVLTAPGNHDVCWPLAMAQRIDVREKILTTYDPIYPELSQYAFSPFREFSRQIEPAERWNRSLNYWVSGKYRHAGLILFGVNSSEDLDSWGVPSRKLTDKTLANLFREICELRREVPHALVVGLMHHPLDQSDESILNAAEFKRNVTEATGSIVLLTGHVHEDATTLTATGNRPSVLQIGSSTFTLNAAKRPEDSVRGFNLIELRREQDRVVSIDIKNFAIIGHQLRALSSEEFRHDGSGKIISV